jgi:hypothetical protein
VALDRFLAAAEGDSSRSLAKLRDELLHSRASPLMLLAQLDM